MENKPSNRNPYEQYAQHELILRDRLAIDRTILANERTFLAYCRTGLALAITGAGSIRFIDDLKVYAFGIVLIVSGIVVAVEGLRRYIVMKKNIQVAAANKTE